MFNFQTMGTVAEIEDALNQLPEAEFEEVALVVLEKLRKTSQWPPFRKFTEGQVRDWIQEDERELAALQIE